jgi:outer membrane protein insertion porin family
MQKRPAVRPAPANMPFPIKSITLDGNHEYTREQILEAAGLKVGQMAAAKDFDAARTRLEAAGVFEEIGLRFAPSPDGKGYAVSIQVREAGPLFPVRFEDLGKPDTEIQQALRRADPFFGPHISGTQESLDRYAKIIEECLGGKQQVAGKLTPNDAGQLVAVFRPAGSHPRISRVDFVNNQAVPASALSNTINEVAVGMPYSEAEFRRLLDLNIRPFYEACGKVQVAFPEITAKKDPDVNGVIVTVKVDEGATYSLGEVTETGSSLAAETLLKLAKFKQGDVFDIQEVKAGVGRMEKRVRAAGFMRVKSRIDRKVNEQAKTVDLAIHIEDGPRYVLGRLKIQGLDILTEPAIRGMWAIKEGQPFNADYPDYFLSQVREAGVLDDLGETKAVIAPDDAARTVDVTLIFHGEAPKPAPRDRRWPSQ